MKAISPSNTIYLLIITYVLLSCDMDNLEEFFANSGPCPCYGNSITSFEVNLKRVNDYPAGSTIFVERFGYPNADSSTIYNYVVFEKSLPFNDTTLLQIEIKNYTLYLKWKILDANKDSLFGGMTSKLTTADIPILFEVNY